MVGLQTENVVSLVQAANFLPRLDGKKGAPMLHLEVVP